MGLAVGAWRFSPAPRGYVHSVQTLTFCCTLWHSAPAPWQALQHTNWALTNFVPPVEPREHEAHVQMFGLEHMKSRCCKSGVRGIHESRARV